ncbi:3-hydroxyacyl-CoA dehydrogenase [Falsiroseomonas bella]|uniref:L-gulonate 3-dehydrogenase n=1 Tax=Falsiroseomonas bella TaxID=2184016 RepID=A0A317FC00_9PROT|nr:3-hydroxyacyl-CoA dehydrogenase family protein [Falsiroseomonas bella]PWS36644.1 3-hydroxyacyl-CoA dehydrogenase [Falsiroseomonas bella]
MAIKVAVIGAGTMGHALALVYALGGHEVRLTDSSMSMLDKAGGLMETALASLVAHGEAPAECTAEWLHAQVTRLPMLAETVEGADLIVEAIIENPETKRLLFTELDRLAPMDAVIASNTSYLDPFPLIPERRQARSLVMHWYTPPYLVDLVDIVGGPKTDPAIIAWASDLVAAMGKVPLVMQKFVPGYIANRIQSAIAAEVYRLLDEGVCTPEDIDTAVVHGLALRIPVVAVMAKADFTGLPLLQHALRNATYQPPPPRNNSETLDRLIEEGRTGVMTGAGYYEWGTDTQQLMAARDRRLVALKKAMREIGTMAGATRVQE